MLKYISGYCPMLDKKIDISVEYSEVLMTGSLANNYKKVSYCCDYEQNNACNISNGRKCPIYLNASKSL